PQGAGHAVGPYCSELGYRLAGPDGARRTDLRYQHGSRLADAPRRDRGAGGLVFGAALTVRAAPAPCVLEPVPTMPGYGRGLGRTSRRQLPRPALPSATPIAPARPVR